jgi:disulfide bond formation protein DsbB
MDSSKNKLSELIQHNGAYLAFIVALVATLGSLFFSEVMNFIPCTLCWYQRILMYPLVIVALVGAIEQDEFLPKYVLPFSVIGLTVATYHYLLQVGVFNYSPACSTGVPCGGRYINWLGFITIPFLALVAFLLITIIMVVMYRANTAEESA